MAAYSAKESIQLLFQRPNEPLFTAKDNGKTAFEVPSDFYSERYKTIGATLSNRFGEDVERKIHLRADIPRPNLDFAKAIKMRGPFSLFNKKHQTIAGQLIEIFMNAADAESLLSTAAFVKDRVNPYLFLVSTVSDVLCAIIKLKNETSAV